MNPHTDIRAVLVQALLDADLRLPTAYPNVPFEKPVDGEPWAAMKVVQGLTSPVTLGDAGEDAHLGFMQVDLNYPLNEGEVEVNLTVDALARFFTSGRAFRAQSGLATVHVLSCPRSPGREAEGYWRVSVTVNYEARVPRS